METDVLGTTTAAAVPTWSRRLCQLSSNDTDGGRIDRLHVRVMAVREKKVACVPSWQMPIRDSRVGL